MSKDDVYRQVELRNGNTFLVSWVQASVARVGGRVSLVGKEGIWKVSAVYEGTMTREQLSDMRGEQRDFSDCLGGTGSPSRR